MSDPSTPPEGSELAGILGDYDRNSDVYGYVHDGTQWHGPDVWGGMKGFSSDLASYGWPFAAVRKERA